jgi:hypothetical protein
MLTLVNYGETAIFTILLLASILALAVGIERPSCTGSTHGREAFSSSAR